MKRLHVASVAITILVVSSVSARAQDSLVRAKEHYATAAYEEALAELAKLQDAETAGPSTEVASYQLFCLVALGRNQEAKQAVETIVRLDPLYHPPAAQASPRVRAFFEEIRRPLLPAVIKDMYARAKGAFDRKEMAVAAAQFDRVIALIDEDETAPASLESADVRTLAVGFRDLSKVAVAAAPPPPPASGTSASAMAPASTPEEVPAAPAPVPVYAVESEGVTPPVAISRPMPTWNRVGAMATRQRLSGVLALVISEEGKVLSASLPKPLHPVYNSQLLKATEAWSFTPATKEGAPVRYRLLMEVVLAP